MWNSHRIGTLEIDRERAVKDLAQAEPGGFVDSYAEFVCGAWRTCMLWNASGDSSDFRLHDYPGSAKITEYGRKLAYVDDIISENFNLDRLRFVRLARLGPGSVVVPHRDYLELAADLVRIHVPLETDDQVYASEEQSIYRMRFGEVWFLDATKVHSIGSFSPNNRTHLILDFSGPDPHSVVRLPEPESVSLPADSLAPRRPLGPAEKGDFLKLSRILDEANFRDVLAILIKRYFQAEMDPVDVFAWLEEIASQNEDRDLAARARSLREHSVDSR